MMIALEQTVREETNILPHNMSSTAPPTPATALSLIATAMREVCSKASWTLLPRGPLPVPASTPVSLAELGRAAAHVWRHRGSPAQVKPVILGSSACRVFVLPIRASAQATIPTAQAASIHGTVKAGSARTASVCTRVTPLRRCGKSLGPTALTRPQQDAREGQCGSQEQ